MKLGREDAIHIYPIHPPHSPEQGFHPRTPEYNVMNGTDQKIYRKPGHEILHPAGYIIIKIQSRKRGEILSPSIFV
jgi:hypothetical protein